MPFIFTSLVQSLLSETWLLAFGALIFATIILLVYYLAVFSHLALKRKPKVLAEPDEPVTVVICARNEYINLQANLESVLAQDYPDYEVVVVNDGSDDDSKDFLQGLQLEHMHLKVVDLPVAPNFFKGKKFPLSMGIKSATHDLLLLTDADCRPSSNQWLRSMQSFAVRDKQVVLGYGAYESKPGFLNALIRYDTLHIAIQYLGYALFGRPYMGVGRNLMYRKSLFLKNKGFSEHYTLASGDDDLFINRVATHRNTTVALGPESMTISKPKQSFRKWFDQKRRHLTTAKYYSRGDKFNLGLYAFSQWLFYISLIVFFIFGGPWELALVLFLTKTAIQMVIFALSMNKIDKSRMFILSPLFEPALLLVNTLLMVSNRISPKQEWK